MVTATPRSRTRPPPRLRTKTGCLTCRQRRKKCDEVKPRCSACQHNWLECAWPSASHGTRNTSTHEPLKYTQPILVGSEETSTLIPNRQYVLDEAVPKSSAESAVEKFESPYLQIQRALSCAINSPQPLYSPPGLHKPSDKWSILHFINELGPFIVRSHSHAGFFDHSYVVQLALHNPSMMDALVAFSSVHKAAHSVDDYPMAVERYGSAIKSIRRMLDSKTLNGTEDWLLLVVDFLCLFERWNSYSVLNPTVHLTALIQMLKARYAKRDVSLSSPYVHIFERTMAESVLYHFLRPVLTLDPFPNSPRWINSPLLGYSPRLFEIILKILKLRLFVPLSLAYRQEAYSLYHELLVLGLESPNFDASHTDKDVKAKMEACWDTTRLFYLSAKILLLKFIHPEINSQSNLVQVQVKQAWEILAPSKPSTFRYDHYLTWPLTIIGLCAIGNTERTIICDILQKIWDIKNCGEVKRSLNLLKRVWVDCDDQENCDQQQFDRTPFKPLDLLTCKNGLSTFY
ncbi:fungal-specific transcription factor domain-containing protein [Talaromyces proteolyticus]|uniref:Fungal-specific transcription factor domain-containing protein n=1 Tax=Talaromyces proteolyticus TaxID=1131652 RepID=A0AAD4L714_9EURO|nr:fungal-specific transcription factor domain-containing protein [Talaromyces proteolyticus]KAH8705770.1 fungal-specific transcription factor domain-containing protein [Talaromyces proteolyticus]